MTIQQKPTGHREMFYIEQEGVTVAELMYSTFTAGIMVIEHTRVDDSLTGQGVGLQLVQHAVEYARAHQLQVDPQCSFAKSVLAKKPEFADVLKRDRVQ